MALKAITATCCEPTGLCESLTLGGENPSTFNDPGAGQDAEVHFTSTGYFKLQQAVISV